MPFPLLVVHGSTRVVEVTLPWFASSWAGGKLPLRVTLSHPDVLKLLLEHGADPNLHFADGFTALLQLLRRKQGEYMRALTVLLDYGADPNIAHAGTGNTPLMIATLDLNVDLVKLLLEHGADVTQVDREGKSVLDMLGRTRKYGEVRELCTQYIERNLPGAKLLLK